MSDTKYLYFSQDAYYNGEHIFEAGKAYEVPVKLGWADRWIKRGAKEIERPSKQLEIPLPPPEKVEEILAPMIEKKPKKKVKDNVVE